MGKYTQLSITDRRRLYVFLEMGLSVTEIAQKLSRNRSTLYRELHRNQETEGYLPGIAQQKADTRTRQGRGRKLEKDPALHEYVIRALKKGWSPEQISGRMRFQKINYYACHETIYQHIYKSRHENLYHYLANKKPKRRKRYSRKAQRCRYGAIRLITQRPAEINTRKRFGHWEGDSIEFKGTKEKTVTTLVERKTRMVYLIKNNRKYSRGIMNNIKNKFENLPKKMLKTLTFDQGCEFADYPHLEHQNECKVYYCQAHSPWQKGSNENMNGRLRRYLPREVEIDKVTQEELNLLAEKMNRLPRKCLGFKTPNEMFIQQHKNDCRTWD
jgi:transposase, IS30 family